MNHMNQQNNNQIKNDTFTNYNTNNINNNIPNFSLHNHTSNESLENKFFNNTFFNNQNNIPRFIIPKLNKINTQDGKNAKDISSIIEILDYYLKNLKPSLNDEENNQIFENLNNILKTYFSEKCSQNNSDISIKSIIY